MNEQEIIDRLKNIGNKEDPSSPFFQFEPEEEILIAWEAVEKEHYPRGPLWYIGFLVGIAIGVLYGIFTGSWSTVIVFLLIPVATILYSSTPPKKNEIFITHKGIYINKKFTPYKEISEFWILDDHHIKKLGFRQTGFWQFETEILLHDMDKEIVRSTLKKFIKEDTEHIENIFSHLIRLFRL